MMFETKHVLMPLLLLAGLNTVHGEDLAQDVRAILSNRCFACHGPDAEERQGGFRLDESASYLAEADSGEFPVVVGEPEKSELLRRIMSDDEYEQMPPPEFAAKLTETEIGKIRKWIAEGAELPAHWSFIAPTRPELPATKHPELNEWSSHPVDQFVHAKQLQRKLQPSTSASRPELLRRLSLDLTGLPPTPEEVSAFVEDTQGGAYERQVDRLLASPAFGEHWARKWLDLARYADSAGYADDPPRTIWGYRDWVVDALNRNVPVDEFTIKQLAGDLLPNPTQDDLLATAFHRNTLTNNEGGTNNEEFRNVAVVDRVNTTLAVWMGVTMACAQCHTHKYDPFTHQEYFQLFAIFNQSQDADRRDESPTIPLYAPSQLRDRQLKQQRLEALDAKIAQLSPKLRKELGDWEQELDPIHWQAISPNASRTDSGKSLEVRTDASLRVAEQPATAKDIYYLDFELEGSAAPIEAIRIKTLPDDNLPGKGAGFAGGNFVLTNVSGQVRYAEEMPTEARYVRIDLPGKNKILSLAEVQVFSDNEEIGATGKAKQSSTDYGGQASRAIDGNTDGNYEKNSTTHTASSDNPWWELDLGGPHSVDRVVLWNRTGGEIHRRLDGARLTLLDTDRKEVFREDIKTAPKADYAAEVRRVDGVEFQIAVADFSQKGFEPDAAIDGQASSGWAVAGGIQESHTLDLLPRHAINSQYPAVLTLKLEFESQYENHQLASFAVETTSVKSAGDWMRMPHDVKDIVQRGPAERTRIERERLATYFAQNVAGSTAKARAEKQRIAKQLEELKPATSVPIMREVDASKSRKTFVQIRGNYKALGQEVQPGTPAVFPPLKEDGDGVDRLDLARWLVDPRNPLTARVWMNRMWESLFGIGIVRSSEEFGSQGDRPTHPELLDWLACELIHQGWDHKKMLRLLVTSETYQQTSQVSQEMLKADQDNIWLARGPRVRLSAEMVRDQALAAAGLLAQKLAGPPVRPPQPDMGLKAAFGSATDWKASQGEDRYRRGLYTLWRRSNPYPSMATFDAPSREVCTLRRDATNTPLQALVTLNDPAFVEAAQGLARRVAIHEAGQNPSDADCVTAAFEYCTCRKPSTAELDALLELLAEARSQLSADSAAAMDLATNPLGPLPQSGDAVELAALTAVCNVLLNLDEVLMKR